MGREPWCPLGFLLVDDRLVKTLQEGLCGSRPVRGEEPLQGGRHEHQDNDEIRQEAEATAERAIAFEPRVIEEILRKVVEVLDLVGCKLGDDRQRQILRKLLPFSAAQNHAALLQFSKTP